MSDRRKKGSLKKGSRRKTEVRGKNWGLGEEFSFTREFFPRCAAKEPIRKNRILLFTASERGKTKTYSQRKTLDEEKRASTLAENGEKKRG